MEPREVERLFKMAIVERLHSKPEILKMIMAHERLPLVLNQLNREIRAIIMKRPQTKVESLQLVIKDLAVLFAQVALQQKKETLLSSAERTRRITEAGRIADIQSHAIELEREVTTTDYISRRIKTSE